MTRRPSGSIATGPHRKEPHALVAPTCIGPIRRTPHRVARAPTSTRRKPSTVGPSASATAQPRSLRRPSLSLAARSFSLTIPSTKGVGVSAAERISALHRLDVGHPGPGPP